MSQITLFFQPPLYWQQFEDLAEAVFPFYYGDPRPQKVGRPGQSQAGVDVYGRCSRTNEWVGIQCKRLDDLDKNNQPLPGGPISIKYLRAAYKEALAFKPALGSWILATTAKRDAKIQEAARRLDDESVQQGRFRVYVWFWDDFVSDLNRHHELQSQYYSQVLHLRGSQEQDKLILELYAEAFSRPAFQDPLHAESSNDFIRALKDTQRAMNTGELVDRETRRVIKRTVGGLRCIANEEWRKAITSVYGLLKELRGGILEGLANGEIREHSHYLDIQPYLASHLSILREQAVRELNTVLKDAGLNRIP
jgi:hypothetical protein